MRSWTWCSAVITVDKRAGSAELLPYFPPGVAELGNLQFGDFAFTGRGPDGEVKIGVERKQILDLVKSIRSGRLLQHQLPGLISTYDYCYLVVEGVWKVGDDYLLVPAGKRWRTIHLGMKHLEPMLNTLAVMGGVIVRQTQTKANTAHLVHHLYRWWQKPWEEHLTLAAKPRKAKLEIPQPSLVAKVAAQLPGVGRKRLEAVCERFPTVVELVEAAEDIWAEIVGPKTAKKLRRAMGHE